MKMGYKNLSFVITICHDSANLEMPNGDPRDGFFDPSLTLMIDSYILVSFMRKLAFLYNCAIVVKMYLFSFLVSFMSKLEFLYNCAVVVKMYLTTIFSRIC